MNSSHHTYALQGVVQPYAWGGYEFLSQLLGHDNSDGEPQAEYWLGIHPKGAAEVQLSAGATPLPDFLAAHPALLGDEVQQQFGELPFLFKILDVRQMLSIQLHPTIPVAEVGFAREEAAGIPRLAPNRNYKDQNHKPEVMVALTDFWLLHGFRAAGAIGNTLKDIPAWDVLLPTLARAGVKGLYAYVMQLPADAVTRLLRPLYEDLATRHDTLTKDAPDFWAWRAFEQYTRDGQYDRGIFSIYWFNLVQLRTGEGIFQGAGIPHAYLEGVNVELMANSDNVLRGGLTPKHIDVPELLANVETAAVQPKILRGDRTQAFPQVRRYPIPVPDFELVEITLSAGETLNFEQRGPGIFLVLAGQLSINEVTHQSGDAIFSGHGGHVKLQPLGTEPVKLFLAFVDKTMFAKD